jgi:hypothetical protein
LLNNLHKSKLLLTFVRSNLKTYIMNARPLYEIAKEIKKDWVKPNYAAKPYLDAMQELNSINDKYGWDNGKTIVLYFLSNASSWKGETAKRIKAELKQISK